MTQRIGIELLRRDNYETWVIQMKAVLIKNDAWKYVSGKAPKPELKDDDETKELIEQWELEDEKAKADLILCILPSELKQIKNCESSNDVWKKLMDIYQSRGPARKASLLKKLIQLKMKDDGDVSEHLRSFFDILDQLASLEITIHDDLVSVMLLYSLPHRYENFRCAIESRDELPPSRCSENQDHRRKCFAISGISGFERFRGSGCDSSSESEVEKESDSAEWWRHLVTDPEFVVFGASALDIELPSVSRQGALQPRIEKRNSPLVNKSTWV